MCSIEQKSFKLDEIQCNFSSIDVEKDVMHLELNGSILIPKDAENKENIVKLAVKITSSDSTVIFHAVFSGLYTLIGDCTLDMEEKMNWLKNNCTKEVYTKFYDKMADLRDSGTIPELQFPSPDDILVG